MNQDRISAAGPNGVKQFALVVALLFVSTGSGGLRGQDAPPLWLRLALESPVATVFGGSAWGDYDGDGDLDLFVSGIPGDLDRPQPFSQLYLNNGDFERVVPNPDGGEGVTVHGTQYANALGVNAPVIQDIWRSAVAWGDYDNDGKLDLIASGVSAEGEPTTRLYRNTGTSDRFEVRFWWGGVSGGALAWGDCDNDGDLDVVESGTDHMGRAVTRLYRNEVRSGDAFGLVLSGMEGLHEPDLRWADYDGDLDLDLLVSGISEPQQFVSRIYRNDGDCRFSPAAVDLGRLFFASADWGDFDADGDLDLLIAGARLTPLVLEGVIRVYENDAGAFSSDRVVIEGRFAGDDAPGVYRGSAAWGDYNNDGRLDFLVAGESDPLSPTTGQVYENRGGGRFSKTTVGRSAGRFTGGAHGSASWGDYDNDGDLDILSSGLDPNRGPFLESFRNHLLDYARNQDPEPPGALDEEVVGGTARLSWSPGSDSATPASGLSYNLRVGTSPGGNEIVSAMAGPSGTRLIPARGNVDLNRRWILVNLPPGTYYWSVQSIDSSYRGSAFSEERTFTVLPD